MSTYQEDELSGKWWPLEIWRIWSARVSLPALELVESKSGDK